MSGASFVLDWTTSDTRDGSMMYDSRNSSKRFVCPETMCIMEFQDESELIAHVASGIHKYVKTASGLDKAILFYAQQKQLHASNEMATSSATSVPMLDVEDFCNDKYKSVFTQGWARKVRRIRRLTDKQKSFITNLFKNGASSKTKLSAEQMAQLMKDKIIDGEHYFNPDELMEPKQIRNFISRLKKMESQPKNLDDRLLEEDGILENIDEICDSLLDFDETDEM